MAVRIYSLAKELKLDSKELVDICTKAGIPGKGSALASLSDEEVTRVKQFVEGGAAKAKPAKDAVAPERSAKTAESSKMRVIVSKPPASARPAPRKPAAEPVEAPPVEAAESPVDGATANDTTAADTTAADTVAAGTTADTTSNDTVAADTATKPAEKKPRKPGPLAGALRREDYVGPGASSGRIPTVGSQGTTKKKPTGNAGGRARPAIKLAPIPGSSQPKIEKPVSKEPAAQKPDMKLPADVMGAGKMGSKPLAAHLRRHERTLESDEEKKKSEAAKGARRGRGREAKGNEAPGGEKKPMLGGREQRQMSRRRPARGGGGGYRPTRRFRRSGANTAAPRKDRVTVELPCTVRELSEAAGVPASDILRILMNEGVMTTITASMDPELTELVAADLGIDVDFKDAVSYEDQILEEILSREDDPADLVERPPVITFLGHVDHGKTSLLDKIIGIDVVSGESGGITQHIRAYTIEKDGRQISFVDTPGHEAFTEMRARGANVTDIAVLIVAADDGVMPQTEEAISHAKAAEVPIVVALNKIDLPGVDENKAMQGLTANELVPSEWGGDVEVVKTSAITGAGVEELIDTLMTVAELHEYKANPNRPALGTCLEAQQEASRGVVAKVIVQNGTLRVGDVVTCGSAFGKVRAMYDTLDQNKRLEEAGPSVPVNLVGFDTAPAAGEHFFVLDDIAKARAVAEARSHHDRSSSLGQSGFEHVTLENLFDRLEGAEEVQTLNLILRADVRGSIEAIQKEFGKLDHPEVRLKILQASVGGVTEADVTLADASDAIVIGFNVVADEGARMLAEQRGVQIRPYSIIYKITEDLRKALEGMLRPEEKEKELGRALVQQVYKISRVGTIAGCRVLSGLVERNGHCRVIRNNTVIGDYAIDTLRREKDDSKEVREGFECGIKLAGFNDIKEGDILEAYKVESIERSFDD